MSNRGSRRDQNRQSRRQATSRQGGRSRVSSQGGGGSFLSWPVLIGVSLLAAVLLALVIVLALPDGGGDDEAVTLSVLDQALEDLPTEMQSGNRLGSDDAPVKLIQFEDFQCVHCLTYTRTIEPFLIEEYVKAGLLQIEFAHHPVVGPESASAAQAAVCAARENRMFEYANRLFARQAQAGFRPDGGAFSEAKLVEVAEELGLDGNSFATCQASPEALGAVARDQDRAREYGFRGTPSFVINGEPLRNPPRTTAGWAGIIEGVIEAATVEEGAGDDGGS